MEAPEGEAGVVIVLDLDERVQHHRAAVVQVHLEIEGVVWLFHITFTPLYTTLHLLKAYKALLLISLYNLKVFSLTPPGPPYSTFHLPPGPYMDLPPTLYSCILGLSPAFSGSNLPGVGQAQD